MFMFNECLIYLCDCTWLNLLHMLNYMLIKNKQIFFLSVLVVFGKCFCFGKISKISKTVQPYFGNCASWVKQVASPQLRVYTKAPGDSLEGQGPSHEKYLENFQKSGFFGFSRLSLASDSRVEAPIARFTQNVWRLPSRLTCEWTF